MNVVGVGVVVVVVAGIKRSPWIHVTVVLQLSKQKKGE